MRKWDHITPEELDTKIEYLKCNFAPDLTMQVIELFNERMQDDEHIDTGALTKLMKPVFERLMAGMSAAQALGLKAGQGKYPREDSFERDVRAATLVVWHMRKGATWENAVTDTAEHMKLESITVQRAYRDYRAGAEYLPDAQLERLAMACM